MIELNAFQTALKSFLSTCLAQATWGQDTKTLAQWLVLENADLLLQAVNSPSYGAALNLTVGDSAVSMDVVCQNLAAAEDYRLFPADLVIRLSLPLRGETFDFTKPSLVKSVEAILETGPHQGAGEALAAFRAMQLRTATIAQHVAQEVGLPSPAATAATMVDINAIIAAGAG